MFIFNSSNFPQQLQNQDFVKNYMHFLSKNHNQDSQMQTRQISLSELPPFPYNFIHPKTLSNTSSFDPKATNQSACVPLSKAQRSASPGFLNPCHSSSNISGEKLAITGNIFEKRADWSIIQKLPIEKQNTIHIRTKDEGPYGNDEIRCFVLSHLSSLKIKQVPCLFCSCDMLVYDRFPLVDGTLFISPYDYQKSKSIPTKASDKSDKHQFMYGICLRCVTAKAEHQLSCKFCGELWQTIGGSSLQIGTLYKYDLVAAFPCCTNRLNCKNCNFSLVQLDAAKQKFFSTFTDKLQCPNCSVVSSHFLKPLSSIFDEPTCLKNKNLN